MRRVDGEHKCPPFDDRFNSRDDFQRGNLVAFEFKEELQVNRTAGKVAGKAASDDESTDPFLASKRLAGVLVLGRGIFLPLLDRGTASVGAPFVLEDCVFRETLRNGLAVGL